MGRQVIDNAKHVSINDFLPVSAIPRVLQLDLRDYVLKMKCANEADTPKKFNAFFQKILQDRRRILDTSLSGYFNEPTATIDISVVDGPIVTWPHPIIPIKLKCDLRRDHKLAIGQLSNRVNDILEQQPERTFVIGAVASDAQIELDWTYR